MTSKGRLLSLEKKNQKDFLRLGSAGDPAAEPTSEALGGVLYQLQYK
jgi:hypothetical protein